MPKRAIYGGVLVLRVGVELSQPVYVSAQMVGCWRVMNGSGIDKQILDLMPSHAAVG